jgi:hypothetical protein
MKIAVIGGGIFGCQAAIEASGRGHEVDLYEAGHNLIWRSSANNPARAHKGFHYPRSPETQKECQEGFEAFSTEYPTSLLFHYDHFYTIADGGYLTLEEYITKTPIKEEYALYEEGQIKVDEAFINVDHLRAEMWRRLKDVRVHLNTYVTRPKADAVVWAVYGAKTSVPLQYEIMECVVLRMDELHRDRSMVVMDGPFFCLDPIANTGLHMLIHVEHSVRHKHVGLAPAIPGFKLDEGMVQSGHARTIVGASARIMPDLHSAQYIGSKFTLKAVLPDREHDDARPTIVEETDDGVRIFSGKMTTCVKAARDALNLLEQRTGSKPRERQRTSARVQA